MEAEENHLNSFQDHRLLNWLHQLPCPVCCSVNMVTTRLLYYAGQSLARMWNISGTSDVV
jgi:hypothetical protein